MNTVDRITQLRRNDPRAAVEVFRLGLTSGDWDPDYYEVLMQLQDDPSKLDRLADEMLRDPHLASRLKALSPEVE